jgi:hypothetical protein
MTRAVPAGPSETVILRQIRNVLQWHGWYVIRIQQGLGCHRGISDLIAVKKGRTVFIEVKKPSGKLSDHQERFRDAISDRGGEYVVMRSVEDLQTFLSGEAA